MIGSSLIGPFADFMQITTARPTQCEAADDKCSGGFPPPNWHHHPQQGGGHVSHSHENVEPEHVHSGRALRGGTYEHPALGPQVDELPPLRDEVIYRIAAILHQYREEQSGSKG